MQESGKCLERLLAAAMVAAALVSCSRSDQVGWADREMPESVTADSTVLPIDSGFSEEEYRLLSVELRPLLTAAMADEELRAEYQQLNADMEEAIAEKSGFYRGLIDRREEIEARFAEVDETGEQMPDSERVALLTHHRNIRYEMGRIREREFMAGEFKEPFWDFKLRLFAKMRELAPDRAAEIDRLQELEQIRPVEIPPPLGVTATPAQ